MTLLLMGILSLHTGLWVRAAELRDPQELARIINTAEELGITDLFVQVVVGGYAYYNSSILPKSEYLSEDYDPLDSIIKLTEVKGIKIHTWINALLYWSLEKRPGSDIHVLNVHPDWFTCDDETVSMANYSYEDMIRRGVDGLFLEPRKDEVREFVSSIAEEVAEKYKVDGIHLDFIRFPGNSFGFCREYTEDYREITGVDPLLIYEGSRWRMDPEEYGKDPVRFALHLEFLKFNEERAGAVTELVKLVKKKIKSVNSAIKLSAAVFPDPGLSYLYIGQDWRVWVEEGILDFAVPMNYTPHLQTYKDRIPAYEEVGREKVWVGTGIWFDENPKYIKEEIIAVREHNFPGIVFFDYTNFKRREGKIYRALKEGLEHKLENRYVNREIKKSVKEYEYPFNLLRKTALVLSDFDSAFKEPDRGKLTEIVDAFKSYTPPENVRKPKEYRAQILYLSLPPYKSPLRKIVRKLEALLIKLLTTKKDFDWLVERFSESRTKKINGDLGYLTDDHYLIRRIKNPQVGKIYGPIRTTWGLYLVKITDIKPEETLPFDSLSYHLKRYIIKKYLDSIIEGRR